MCIRDRVGTESTCALVTEITVSLSPWPKHRTLVVLGYDDIYIAADNVPSLLMHDLIGLEGFDGRLVDQMRRASLNLSLIHISRHTFRLSATGTWSVTESV